MKNYWKNLSVSYKLYAVVGVMGLLIATELLTLRFAMTTLSSVRAFVGGEGLWSKAQKTSVIFLQKYAETGDESQFQNFENALEVPMGDRAARLEMMKPEPDPIKIEEGFVRGKIHRDDIPGLVKLVTRFYWVPHLARALEVWADGDNAITVLMQEAEALRKLVSANAERGAINAQLDRIKRLNDELTSIEDRFSYILGEGSRWLEGVVMLALLLLVLTVESCGVILTVSFSRNLTRSLREIIGVAESVEQGDFTKRSLVDSRDEIGQLGSAMNRMTNALQESIGGRRQAEEASQTKSAFLANMSHEIRTPLAAILGFAEILNDPTLSEEERARYLSIIQRNGHSLTKVINDILDLSKIESGSVMVEELEFFLPAVLEDAVALFSAPASDKGVQLRLNISENARSLIHTDPNRLKQILFNIIGNALKFTERGSVDVNARVEDRKIVIDVRDSGIGLTQEQREKLFSPFTQADVSTSRKYGGTGLGLALSRRLAEALGGTVAIAASAPGEGSTFRIEIENRVNTLRAIKTMNVPSSGRSVHGARVLIADDSADNREILRVLLERHGVKSDFAVNGADAVKIALGAEFDLVLMDIQMPEMDGYGALETLRRKGYRKPVVAFTAHAMKEERDRCLKAGFAAHLTKPISEDLLIQTVAEFR